MAKEIANLPASIRARLLALSKATSQTFDLVLTRFALERLLYRLSKSQYADRFVLKGAMLLTTWFDDPTRPTRDIDLLGFGDPDSDQILQAFREIMQVEVEDGIDFEPDSLGIDRIREDDRYGGVRMRARAILAGARISVVIDIGFGDAIEPGLEQLVYPTLLDFPAPQLRAYAQETVIAEKFQAMVDLGRANSRMKDFYDIWLLAKSFHFENDRLARAIAATFARRLTPIPVELPDALSAEFAADPAKIRQWEAFKEDLALDPGALAAVVGELAEFLMPHAEQARAIIQV
jgi:predicted nucleotidyltransferase component of viral defense system